LAVSLIGAGPNQKQVGDKRIDGVARFPLAKNQFGRILVSVKGGKHLDAGMARDLLGAVVGGRTVCWYVESACEVAYYAQINNRPMAM
jgi:hypothetical protein